MSISFKKPELAALLGVNLVFLALGIFWVHRCRIWTDENWYYHGAVLFSKGYRPYIDFFYHRLPLHVEFYGLLFKIFGSSFVTGRLISMGLWLLLVNASLLLSDRLFGSLRYGLLTSLAFLNTTSLYGYLTNATYSLNALLLILSAAVLLIRNRTPQKVFLFFLIHFLVLSNRYLIDYQSLFLTILIVGGLIYFRKNGTAILALVASSLAGLLYLGKYTLLYGDRNIFFDTISFNFSLKKILQEEGVAVPSGIGETLAQFLRLRLLEFDSFYPWNVLCGIALLLLVFRLWKRKREENETPFLYMGLILSLNFAFYYLSVNDWPVGKLYVYPFMVLLALWLLSQIVKGLPAARERFVWIVFALLFAAQGLSSGEEHITFSREGSDLAELHKVTAAIREEVGGRTDGMILTFTPVLADCGLINDPRLNMEMFAFRPSFSSEEAERYRLMNAEALLKGIRERKYAIVAFSEERFFQGKGVGKAILPYQSRILTVLSENYNLVREIPTGNFRKAFRLYARKT